MRLRNIPEAKNIVENSPFVIQQPDSLRGNWRDFWKNDHPVHLEVGMGKGRFLMEMSQRHPENNYLGMELYDSVLLRAIQRRQALEEPLLNLYFLCADARTLPEIFAGREVQKIYLNFSDPWPKRATPKGGSRPGSFWRGTARSCRRKGRWSSKPTTAACLSFLCRKCGNPAGF